MDGRPNRRSRWRVPNLIQLSQLRIYRKTTTRKIFPRVKYSDNTISMFVAEIRKQLCLKSVAVHLRALQRARRVKVPETEHIIYHNT